MSITCRSRRERAGTSVFFGMAAAMKEGGDPALPQYCTAVLKNQLC
jgi:hypothetical protein